VKEFSHWYAILEKGVNKLPYITYVVVAEVCGSLSFIL